ncbi:zinc finger protein 37 homolog isoform X1 [Zeugodacus cucurbitae]|nr:zinc finger protein 37 homolog isoform X1 [Zeugodacus cucurbitae]
MEIERDNAKIQCTDFKKCGEIATLLSIGKPEFFLNCGFCEYTFLQLDNFIRHMYEDHQNEFPDCELKQELAEMVEEKYSSDTEEIEDHNSVNDFMLKGFEKVEIEVDTSEEHISIDIGENFKKEYWDEEDEEDLLENTLPASAQEECLKEDKKKITETQKYKNELLDDELYSEDTLDDFTITERITKVEIESTSIRRRNEKRKKNTSKDGRMSEETATDSDIPEENENLSYIEENRHIPKKRLKLEEKELANNSDEFDDSNVGKISEENEVSDSGHSENKKKGSLYEAQPQTKPAIMTITTDNQLEDEHYQLLATILEANTCLWNEEDIAYRFKNRREEALQGVRENFNEKSGLNMSINDLESEIVRLRKSCSIEKKQKLFCKRNNLTFRPNCAYFKHIEYLEVDVPPFECTVCGKLLSGLGQYKVHVASHDGSLPFKCHLCGHGFQLASNLTVHLRRHVHDYTYTCKVCNKPCATTTELKIHMRSHTGEKPFVCYICGQKARTSSQLLVHTLRHQNRPRHKCKLCPKTFYETGTLNEHMSVHRNIRDKICETCDKGFTTNKQLRQHQLIHNAVKKYACKLCGKRFAQYAGLSGHMKTHGTKLSANVVENVLFD